MYISRFCPFLRDQDSDLQSTFRSFFLQIDILCMDIIEYYCMCRRGLAFSEPISYTET